MNHPHIAADSNLRSRININITQFIYIDLRQDWGEIADSYLQKIIIETRPQHEKQYECNIQMNENECESKEPHSQ